MPLLSKESQSCSFQCETKLGHTARLVWVGGLGLGKILPIMGVLNNVNRREESMGASQAKLPKIKLQNKNHEAMLNKLQKHISGGKLNSMSRN